MCSAEEVANLSPAKHQHYPSSFQSHTPSSFALVSSASQSSLGFQIMPSNGSLAANKSGGDGDYANYHSSDSASDSGSGSDSDSNSFSDPAEDTHPSTQWPIPCPMLKIGEISDLLPEPSPRKQVVHSEQSSVPDNSWLRDHASPLSPTLPPSSKSSRKKKRRHDRLDTTAALKKPKPCDSYPVFPLVGESVVAAAPLRSSAASVPALPLRLGEGGGVGVVQDVDGSVATGQEAMSGSAVAAVSPTPCSPSSFLVRIPLADLKPVEGSSQQQVPKPKATVEPYNVRSTASSRATPQRRNTSESMPPDREEGRPGPGRDHYSGSGSSRLRTEEYGIATRDLHPARARSHASNRWDREERERRTYDMVSRGGGGGGGSRGGDYGGGRGGGGVDYNSGVRGRGGDYSVVGPGGGGGDYGGRGHAWEREQGYRGNTVEEFWSDTGLVYAGGVRRSRMGPDYYMQEARCRKKEADKILVSQSVSVHVCVLLMTNIMLRCWPSYRLPGWTRPSCIWSLSLTSCGMEAPLRCACVCTN